MSMKLLTIKEVAYRLSVSETTVCRLRDSGQVKCYKVGPKKAYRIPESEVINLIRYGYTIPIVDKKDT